MKMIKIVPDTNVIISGMLGSRGNPRRLLNLSLAKKVVMYGCEETFNEFCEVIKRPKLEKYLSRQLYTPEKIILDYKSIIKIIEPFELLKNIEIANQDRDDDIYFRIAKASRAKIIVSGDKKHVLSVEEFDEIVVVSVTKFLDSFMKLRLSKIY